MRFLARALRGSAIMLACFALLAYGGWRMVEAQRIAAQAPAPRPAPERSFTAPLASFALDSSQLDTTVYGQIQAVRSLELRAGAAGRLVSLGAEFRDGALVREGDVLARVDPATTDNRAADARAGLADAQARLATATGNRGLRQAELDSALQQLSINQNALDRQSQLASRGFATRVTVENAQLTVNSANANVEARRQAIVSLENEIRQAQLAVERARLSVEEANRAAAETVVRAPFSGVLHQISAAATAGRLVGANETLATLVDLAGLEARFQVSGAEYARLIDGSGNLRPLAARVSLTMSDGAQNVPARLTRVGAAVEQGQGGRTLYAALETGAGSLRPGDFVKIQIQEPALENLARAPASAITEDGRVLIFNRAAGRLEETRLEVRRRSGDWVYLADAPIGAEYVVQRTQQLGPGVRFRDPATPEPTRPMGGPGMGGPGMGPGGAGRSAQGQAGAAQGAQGQTTGQNAAPGQNAEGRPPRGEGRSEGAPPRGEGRGEGRPQWSGEGRPEGAPRGPRPEGGRPEGGRPEGAPPSASSLPASATPGEAA